MTILDTMLTMRRGDTPIFDLTVRNADGTPFNLTGCTIWFTAKRNVDDADVDAVIQGSTTSGEITITDAPNGLARIIPLAADTSGLTVDERLFWDVQVKTLAGNVHTVANGVLAVVRDITRVS